MKIRGIEIPEDEILSAAGRIAGAKVKNQNGGRPSSCGRCGKCGKCAARKYQADRRARKKLEASAVS